MPSPISTSAKRFRRRIGVAGIAAHPLDQQVIHAAEKEQAQQQQHLGHDHDAIGGAVDRIDRADVRHGHDDTRGDQQRDGAERDHREAPADARLRPVIAGAAKRQQQIGDAADPRRGRRHVQEIGEHQRRAVVELCRGMAGRRLRQQDHQGEYRQRREAKPLRRPPNQESGKRRRHRGDRAEAGEVGTESIGERDVDRSRQHHAFEQDEHQLERGEGDRRPQQQAAATFERGVAAHPERRPQRPRQQHEEDDAADGERLRRQHEAAQHHAEETEDVEQQRHRLFADGERNVAPGDVPVDGEHLPAQPVMAGRQSVDLGGERVGTLHRRQRQRLR